MKAIITGATKGVGRATALALASEGYKLAIGARSLTDLESLKKELLSKGSPEVFVRTVDFSSKFEGKNFSESIKSAWGNVDVIVNNVGIFSMGKIDEEEDGLLEKMLNVNLFSAYYTTLPFLKGMRDQKSGHIFNICSIVSKKPRATAPSYSISKHALAAFNHVLREDLQESEVKVTAIYSGSINTSSWDGIEAPKDDFVQPEDIASAIVNALNAKPGTFIQEIVMNPINKDF